jgi:hypothetical protein
MHTLLRIAHIPHSHHVVHACLLAVGIATHSLLLIAIAGQASTYIRLITAR